MKKLIDILDITVLDRVDVVQGYNSGNEFQKTVLKCFIVRAQKVSEDKDAKVCTFETFLPRGRYMFDYGLDLTRWCQMDTKQDASYYGHWINPELRSLICYCEGDIYVKIAADAESFMKMIQDQKRWHTEQGCWIGIDPGLGPTEFVQQFMGEWKNWEESYGNKEQ